MSEVIASVSGVRKILAKYNLRAEKRFGQNFLISENIVKKIAIEACEKDLPVIEVGPGIGSLTQQLAKYSKCVYAYEIDKKLPSVLKEELKDLTNVKIIQQDFLTLDLEANPHFKTPLTFCSNLPYYITTPILFKLISANLPIQKITVMMQKEVAMRLSAKPKESEYGALTVIINYLYEVKTLFQVKRTFFLPVPNVDSTVIQLSPIKKIKAVDNAQAFYTFVQKCFVQRRKTLFNNLRAFLPLNDVNDVLNKCNLKIETRAQELDVNTFIAMYEVIYERKSVC